MLINLSDVLSDQHKTVEETVSLDMEAVRLKAGSFPIVGKTSVYVIVTHVEDRELQIKAEAKVCVRVSCDRCLQHMNQELVLNFVKCVDLNVSDADLPEGLDESNFINGYHLDVDKMIFNEMLIGWPMKVLCSEDCKGICNLCGHNLNRGVCDCEDAQIDPRMSVVRDLFKNFKEV